MSINILFYIFFVIIITSIAIEALYSYNNQKKLYNLKDSLVNVFFGASGVINRALVKGLWFGLWIYLYQFSFIKIPETFWTWILLFFCNEFVFYWYHRWSHENKYLWAVHVNHHSSELLNFSTAIRHPFFAFIFYNIFWIPLLFAGFNPTMIFAVENTTGLFTFYQHTQVIKTIPYFDFIFNTPSHHRVHHSSNHEYVNKNYGLVLIIFDRLFGTFKEEQNGIEIKYGISENLKTYNLIKIVFHEWIHLLKHK